PDERVPHEEALGEVARERRLVQRVGAADGDHLGRGAHWTVSRASVSQSAGSSSPSPQKTTPTSGGSVCVSHAASVHDVDVASSNHVSWAPPVSSCQSK